MATTSTEGNDRLTGMQGRDALVYYGGHGDDTLDGSEDSDTLYGGAGDDTLDGRAGDDTLDGGDGNDMLDGGAGNDTLDGGDGNDTLDGGDGNDTLNPGANDDRDLIRGSAGDDTIVYTGIGDAPQELEYEGYAASITATIDGSTNRATVDKGKGFVGTTVGKNPPGTDTILDIKNVVACTESPSEDGICGFGLRGTAFNDAFNLTLDERQWMQVSGLAGNDTFNLSGGGNIRLDYRKAVDGIDIDLGAGRANDDGFGDVDTINGRVWEIRGSDYSDRIVGSDMRESFIGRQGDDTIDGGGGFDLLRFDRTGISDLDVDLSAGTATGTWNSRAFAYRISNIEEVRGGSGNDTLRGSASNDTLEGGDGDDSLTGGKGRDTFIFGAGDGADTITDFTDGEDRISFEESALTWQQILTSSTVRLDGGVRLDLSAHGGGTIDLIGTTLADLDPSDFIGLSVVPTPTANLNPDATERGDDSANTLTGGDGDDNIYGEAGDDALLGGAGDDYITGGAGDDRLWGQAGDDGLDGGEGSDLIFGQGGNDTIAGGDARDIVLGGDGDDYVDGGAGDDGLWSEGGNDNLAGGDGEDFLAGGEGDDSLRGGAGRDYLDGEGGNDILDGGTGYDVLAGGGGADRLIGGNEGDTFFGQGGADVFVVAGGLNWIMDFDGADRLDVGMTLAQVQAAATQAGTHLHVALEGGDLYLANTTLADIGAENLIV